MNEKTMTAPPAGALPSLPEPDFLSGNCNIGESAYTAEQMREYALLAALRLRERCERARMDLRLMACDMELLRPNDPLSVVGRKHYAERIRATADDLARVLEESATGGEATSA